jgi:enamine deaminase RidA (YjgF/YER057c/UK114 family)
MPQFLNPPTLARPTSRYSQAVLVEAGAERLIISGQVATKPDGTIVQGLAAQTEQIFDNLEAALAAAGMTIRDLVKLTIFCVAPGGAAQVREIRNRRLGDHAPASTFVQVAGLANPDYLLEIEGEAVRSKT